MFGKLFGRKKTEPLSENIFPEESWTILKVDLQEGLAFATINSGYKNYQFKDRFPWHALVELEVQKKNDNGHPEADESVVLEQIEDRITSFLKKTQVVHVIGRLTRNGARELFYYIDQPRLDQVKTKAFLDEINSVRNLNFSMERDPSWERVGAFL